ncbi:hypothetical protein LEMLEM_LOCUS15554 [Lemmus lemmus]
MTRHNKTRQMLSHWLDQEEEERPKSSETYPLPRFVPDPKVPTTIRWVLSPQ